MIFASGIGDIELGFAFLRRKQKKARAKTSAQLNLAACVKFKMDQLGYSQRDAVDSCKPSQLRGCGCLGAAAKAAAPAPTVAVAPPVPIIRKARPVRMASPYRIMTTGCMPYFNPGNPYVAIAASRISKLVSSAVR